MNLKAFNDKQEIKDFYISRLEEHYKNDEIIKGIYWEDGKGCAVGCTIHSNNHSLYESELEIPKWLAKVEDRIFEGLPNNIAKEWPLKFLKSIKVGSDLEKIKIPFLIFIVESVLDKFDHTKYPKTKIYIENVLSSLKNNEKPADAADAAAAYADAAAVAAAAGTYADAAAAYADAAAVAAAAGTYAAYADAYAYAAADAYADVAAAAYAAAVAAAGAAAGAGAGAGAAVAVAGTYTGAAYAGAAAKEKTYEKFADKLIELIENN